MASLKDIKRRIVSVQNTQKITRAMKMVAAAKLRRAQEAIEAARPYAERMRSTLEEVAGGMGGSVEHPLFEERERVRNLEVVVITSDRGLAGAFNNAVLKLVDQLLAEREGGLAGVRLTLIGKKAGDYYKRRRANQIASSRAIGNNASYSEAASVSRGVMDRFQSGEVDEVMLVFSEFISTMTQRPRTAPLLPFSAPEKSDGEESLSYEIEPSPEELLAVLVPKAVEIEIFRALLESQAGEHAARMTAMESATRNTEDLIERLNLQYNRARQAAITRELVEIVTGAQALE